MFMCCQPGGGPGSLSTEFQHRAEEKPCLRWAARPLLLLVLGSLAAGAGSAWLGSARGRVGLARLLVEVGISAAIAFHSSRVWAPGARPGALRSGLRLPVLVPPRHPGAFARLRSGERLLLSQKAGNKKRNSRGSPLVYVSSGGGNCNIQPLDRSLPNLILYPLYWKTSLKVNSRRVRNNFNSLVLIP